MVAESVTTLDEKQERRFAAVETRIDRNAADTQAMIRFSHAELERRMQALEQSQQLLADSHQSLEQTVAEMQSRLERLESSTH